MPEALLEAGTVYQVIDLLVEYAMAPSKTEARRLLQGGALKVNGVEKLTEATASLQLNAGEERILQVGKRKFIRFKAN
jgi:tyrosyl-tRNA synthetase